MTDWLPRREMEEAVVPQSGVPVGANCEDGLLRIEIGAGTKGREGYIHVDAVDGPHTDVVDDGRTLATFSPGVAAEIYSHWFLEHVASHEVAPMLAAWKRVLAPGGQVRIITNNHEAHNRCLEAGEISWKEWTYLIYAVSGKQNYNVWDVHKSAWNEALLREVLEEAGFVDIKVKAAWKCREDDGRLKCPGLEAIATVPVEAAAPPMPAPAPFAVATTAGARREPRLRRVLRRVSALR
jgi:predicted SAM-dependent methyltransferase